MFDDFAMVYIYSKFVRVMVSLLLIVISTTQALSTLQEKQHVSSMVLIDCVHFKDLQLVLFSNTLLWMCLCNNVPQQDPGNHQILGHSFTQKSDKQSAIFKLSYHGIRMT